MKKTILILSGIFTLSLAAFADNVSEPRARAYAAELLKNVAPVSSSSYSSGSSSTASGDGLTLVYCGSGSSTKAASSQQVPFYAYNRAAGGCAIISGVDNMTPVIFYSENGFFDPENICPPMAWWLKGVEKTVAYYRDNHIETTMDVAKAWLDGASVAGTKADGDILLGVPEWNQSSPFNDRCPSLTGGQPVTGCVPTAICEVMAYYKYPTKGTGTIPSYTFSYNSKNYTAGGYELTTEYDWTNIAKVTAGSTSSLSDAVKGNLAQLLTDVGQAMQVSYGLSSTGGTSGHTSRISYTLGTYFGYNKAAVDKFRDQYDSQTWYSMILNEIQNGRPVIYSGNDPSDGGHCFVFDGANTTYLDRVHVNFGWGPGNNGWTSLGANFYGNQDAIIGFQPDSEGTSSFAPSTFSFMGGETFVLSGSLSSTFSMSVGPIFRDDLPGFVGSVKLVRVNKSGNYVDDVTTSRSLDLTNYAGMALTFSNCSIKGTISFGDRIVMYMKRNGESDWSAVAQDVQGGSASYYPLTGHPRIVADNSYKLNSLYEFRLDNMKYSYMYSPYAAGLNSSYGCLCEWDFFVDGEHYQTVNNVTTRYITLDKAGTWLVRCKMIRIGSSGSTYYGTATASFTVTN